MGQSDEPSVELKEAVLKNDSQKIVEIIQSNEYLLNYTYPEENKSILLFACSEDNVKVETVSTLLDLKANPRDFTEIDGWETLHWAASKTNYDILNIILEKFPETINVIDKYENNALHILIRYGEVKSEAFQKCVELLVGKGIDVNQKNRKNMTPKDWAIKKKLNKQILEIIENHIGDNKQEINKGQVLFGYLKEGNIEDFINFNDGNIEDWINYTEGSYTLLQMCCEKGLTEAAIHLLNKGADCELTCRKNSIKPIIIAAERGEKDIFEALLNKYNEILSLPKEVLPTILQYIDREYHNNIGCYNTFMKKLKEADPDEVAYLINKGNIDGNTALHYAVVYAEPDVINELLSLGASLGAKNKLGIMPIKNIELPTITNHLDKCVIFDLKRRQIDREDFKVKFNYRNLIPPYLELSDTKVNFNKDLEASEVKQRVQKKLVAETEVLYFMSKNSELKELLKHPTITSFLYMKWLRIQWLFWINLLFYVIFAVSLLTFIFTEYATEKSILHPIVKQFLHVIIFVGWVLILARELFQIFVAPWKYFINIENYIEIFLVILCARITLFLPSDDTKKLFSSLLTLLISFELILMLGQHPKFSTNVVMFRTVSSNFYKFLMWYSLPIIAFAISFYLLLATKDPNDEHDKSFNHPVHSVFRTLVMLTGEFNASDINFDTFPVISQLIFMAFIFTIAIILLNLLNGLAVSDTQMIKDDAELVGLIARTQFIRNIEVTLLGNTLIIKYITKIIHMCRVCIFPKYFNYDLTFYPRKHGEVDMTWSKHNVPHSKVFLENDTVLKTSNIIQAKRDEEIQSQDDPITRIEHEQNVLKDKVDNILQILDCIKSKISTSLRD